MNIEEYRQIYLENDKQAPGWDAIDNRLDALYGDQEPMHWGTMVRYSMGGPDPIDGISAYRSTSGAIPHFHFCSYGFTSLYYDEDSVGGEFSGYGFELTFRLVDMGEAVDEQIWVCNLIQNLARYVFESGNWFEPYHWIPANGPIRADDPTEIVGLAFVPDPELPASDSPHGKFEFLQMFGLTESELQEIQNKERTCKEVIEGHRQENPLLITDLRRKNTV